MDLRKEMVIEIVTAYTEQPATPAGVAAFTGERILYAFHDRHGNPYAEGCICNECAADDARLFSVRSACYPSLPADEPLESLDSERARYWVCCSCDKKQDGRRSWT